MFEHVLVPSESGSWRRFPSDGLSAVLAVFSGCKKEIPSLKPRVCIDTPAVDNPIDGRFVFKESDCWQIYCSSPHSAARTAGLHYTKSVISARYIRVLQESDS